MAYIALMESVQPVVDIRHENLLPPIRGRNRTEIDSDAVTNICQRTKYILKYE